MPTYSSGSSTIWTYPRDQTRLRLMLGLRDSSGRSGDGGRSGPTIPSLWKTDGTAAGTTLVKSSTVVSGGRYSDRDLRAIEQMGVIGNSILFSSYDVYGAPEWRFSFEFFHASHYVSELDAGELSPAFRQEFADNRSALGASATVSTLVPQLQWKIDDPESGREYKVYKDGNFGRLISVYELTPIYRERLWKSDGTTLGTVPITWMDTHPGPGDLGPTDRVLNGELYIGGCDDNFGCELWKTDGTTAGTVMVKDINPGPATSIDSRRPSIVLGGTLLFVANDGIHGYELWKTDGTAAGTVMVKDINPGPATSIGSGFDMVVVGNRAYFQANTVDGIGVSPGRELWYTDGTAAGTTTIAGDGYGLTVSGDVVYFAHRAELDEPEVDNGGSDVWRIPSPSDADTDGISDDLESSFGGTQPEESLAITNSETGHSATAVGSSATGATISSGSFEIDFPSGTSVDTAGGADSIEIAMDLDGTSYTASVEIAGADLDGGTKTITLPFDGGASEPAVCIDDSPTASVDSLLVGGTCSAELVPIPAVEGDSVTVGAHTVTRLSDSPARVEVDGLSNTALATFGIGSPVVGQVTSTAAPVEIGTSVSASADFSDADGSSWSASFDWGDGSSSAGAVDGSAGNTSGNHVYGDAGVYTVTVSVTDDDGNTARGTYQFVVVYDPDGGFVTGGGWIDSPEGAYTANSTLTGRAHFGFVSKYKNGADTPEGDTNFRFNAGGLHFESTSYDWLVVAGYDRAKFKGSGVINESGNYGFMLTATDDDPDTFRIKIWDKNAGDGVVYDNKLGSDDDGHDGTELGGGNIKVHKK